MDAGEQQRASQRRARDDAGARDQRGDRLAAAAFLIVDELGWRCDLGIGPDRPRAIVEVELGHHVGEIDVGAPIGVDGAGIAPVGARIVAGADAGIVELMRDRAAVLDDIGDDVLAEIVRRVRVGGIAAQFVEQEFRIEDIDTHDRGDDDDEFGKAHRAVA